MNHWKVASLIYWLWLWLWLLSDSSGGGDRSSMSSSALLKSASFDEQQQYSYESIGGNSSRYSVGSTAPLSSDRASLLPDQSYHYPQGSVNCVTIFAILVCSQLSSSCNIWCLYSHFTYFLSCLLTATSQSSYQNYCRDIAESRYHSDQGVDRRRHYLGGDRDNRSHVNYSQQQQLVHAKIPRTGTRSMRINISTPYLIMCIYSPHG